MIAGNSGSTHGDSTLKTPAPNAMKSEGIWGSVMSCNRRARVLILGVNDWRLFVIFWNWVLENHRDHRGHRENSNSMCPPRPDVAVEE